MIGCNERCIRLACCDFCIWCYHNNEGEPTECSLHEDRRHQDLVLSSGACNDFHCFNANKPDRWIEIDVCDT